MSRYLRNKLLISANVLYFVLEVWFCHVTFYAETRANCLYVPITFDKGYTLGSGVCLLKITMLRPMSFDIFWGTMMAQEIRSYIIICLDDSLSINLSH